MILTEELKEKIKVIQTKEEAEDFIEKFGIVLTDDEFENDDSIRLLPRYCCHIYGVKAELLNLEEPYWVCPKCGRIYLVCNK